MFSKKKKDSINSLNVYCQFSWAWINHTNTKTKIKIQSFSLLSWLHIYQGRKQAGARRSCLWVLLTNKLFSPKSYLELSVDLIHFGNQGTWKKLRQTRRAETNPTQKDPGWPAEPGTWNLLLATTQLYLKT